MKTLQLDVTKEECEETCPLPLELIPELVDGVERLDAGETVTIEFDEAKQMTGAQPYSSFESEIKKLLES